MSDSAQTTGASRTERVLGPGFAEGVAGLAIEELKRRRDEALAEREFQSYVRRLIQVRHDILRAEKTRRVTGEPQQPLVERLTSVLSGGPVGKGRGEALRLDLSDDDLARAELRAANLAADDKVLANPETLDDRQLDDVLVAAEAEEQQVSSERAVVIKILDEFQRELQRRYREDPSLVTPEA
jgi:hypothetical protein